MKCVRNLGKAGEASGQKLSRVPEARYHPSAKRGYSHLVQSWQLLPVSLHSGHYATPSVRAIVPRTKNAKGYAADDPENEEHDARGAEGRAGEVEHVPVEGVEEHAGPEEQADERSTTGEPQRAEQEETGVGFGHTEGVGRVGSVEARRSRAGGLRRRP